MVLLRGEPGVDGQVLFTETPEGLLLEGSVSGLKPGKHGFHIHQFGDLTKGCVSTGGHYNPNNVRIYIYISLIAKKADVCAIIRQRFKYNIFPLDTFDIFLHYS